MGCHMVRLVLAAIVFFGLWYLSQAKAQVLYSCTSQEQLTPYMAEQYDEHPAATGIDGNGRLILVYASEFGAWTMLIVFNDGPRAGEACSIAYGEGWRVMRRSDEELC